jgi:hypothetical protein
VAKERRETMPGSRILLSCLLLVVLGCAHGADVRQPTKDPRIGVWTPDDAENAMNRRPDYRYDGDEGIVMAWIDHYRPETKFLAVCYGTGTPVPTWIEIPHGRHTHYVFDRETKRLMWQWVKQW